MQEKLTLLADAIARIRDGEVVALQNMATQAAPMASVRELIRQQKRDLALVVLVGGLAVDWLAAAGVISRLIGAAVSMEQFGLCQQYRKAVEQGRIRVEELSETLLNARLGAGARNLPFLPSRGAIGSDLIALNPENLIMLDDPFGGPQVIACRAHDNAVAHGFWSEDDPANLNTILAKIALMHSELSEAIEAVRHHNPPDDKIPAFSGLEAELADCIIRIMDLCPALDLRVAPALIAKMAYNRGRPHKHGKAI